MFSIEYFIGFIVLGLLLRLFLGGLISFLLIIGVTIGWAFAYGPWAVLTFVELLIGFGVIQGLSGMFSKEENDQTPSSS